MEKLSAGYADDSRVNDWVSTFETYAKRLSYGFDDYGAGEDDEPKRNGPGLYVAFVSGNSIESFADQPQANPFDERDGPQYVPQDVPEVSEADLQDADDIYEGVKEVANDMDYAMVVWMNGRIHEYNVRFLDPRAQDILDRIGDTDRGTRHRSAMETSARPEVEFTLTLSEEDGTVTRYKNGEQEGRKYEREDIIDEFEADD